MNLLVVADLHYALKQFDWILSVAADHDAVVIAGDLLEVASVVPQDAQIVVVTEYLRRLSEITQVFVCSGNHDLDVEGPGGERIAGWLAGLGSRPSSATARPSSSARRSFRVFPGGRAPRPRGDRGADGAGCRPTDAASLDLDPSRAAAGQPGQLGRQRSFGDQELSDWIAEFSPTLVLSGHVHQAPFVAGGRWVDRIDNTWVFNMGQQIGEAPTHVIIDTEAGGAAWFSLAGTEGIDLRDEEAAPERIIELPDWLTVSDRTCPRLRGGRCPGAASGCRECGPSSRNGSSGPRTGT